MKLRRVNIRRGTGDEPVPSADEGSTTVWVLAVGLVVILVALSFAVAGAAVTTRHKAQAAADLAALGGALRVWEGEGAACQRAADIAARNGARLASCRLDGLDVVIEVEVSPPRLGVVGVARAAARAGPVDSESWLDPEPRHAAELRNVASLTARRRAGQSGSGKMPQRPSRMQRRG